MRDVRTVGKVMKLKTVQEKVESAFEDDRRVEANSSKKIVRT